MSTDTQSIVVEYNLSQPPEKVWRALTDPKLVAQWLMPNDLQPVVGHRFTFQAQPLPGWDGVIHCEVLEADPPRRLVYSWEGGSDDLARYGSRLDTTVTWTLTPAGSGTHLRMEHAGFQAKDAFAFDNMGKGWRGKIAQQFEKIVASLA